VATALCPRAGYSQEPTRAPQNENKRSCHSEIPAGVVYCPDLIYAAVGQRPLMLDISYPSQNDGPYPAVIFLPGAGPASKGRKGLVPWATKLAQNGYVGIAVSYRCKPEDTFPAPVRDIQSAVRWLRDHAAQYKIDKDRLGLIGFSCGGCLACLVGMSPADDNAEGQDASRDQHIQAVVSYSAPTDLTRWYEGCVRDNKNAPTKFMTSYIKRALEKWLGGPPNEAPDLYVKASPIEHVRKDGPPILLIVRRMVDGGAALGRRSDADGNRGMVPSSWHLRDGCHRCASEGAWPRAALLCDHVF
jgi:acetyl esterase/lipase